MIVSIIFQRQITQTKVIFLINYFQSYLYSRAQVNVWTNNHLKIKWCNGEKMEYICSLVQHLLCKEELNM